MIRNIYYRLLCFIYMSLLILLVGCGRYMESTEESLDSTLDDAVLVTSSDVLLDKQPSTEQVSENEPSNPIIEDTLYESGIAMSDDLMDFTLEIDGTVYRIPMLYSELVKAGWSMPVSKYYSESDLLDPERHASATMKKGEKDISIGFINMSGNIKPLNECVVGKIEIFAVYDENRRVSAKLACGIEQYVSTYSDVVSAWGEPDSTMGPEDDLSIVYYPTEDGKIHLFFNAEQVLSGFMIENEISLPSDETTTDEAVPEFFKNYTAPVQLGNNPLENVVEWRGDLYTLPAPISAFEENGWTVAEYRIDTLKAKDYYGNVLILERNGEKEWLNLYNIADYQTVAENCVVTQLGGWTNKRIILSGGITCGSSLNDVEKLVGHEDMSEVDWEYRFKLSNPDTKFSVEIIVDKNDNLVSSIEVTCFEWQFN